LEQNLKTEMGDTDVAKKTRKGIFKNSGEKITEEQQDPMARSKAAVSSNTGIKCISSKHSYLMAVSSK
jgi:hypothetical protein